MAAEMPSSPVSGTSFIAYLPNASGCCFLQDPGSPQGDTLLVFPTALAWKVFPPFPFPVQVAFVLWVRSNSHFLSGLWVPALPESPWALLAPPPM